MPDQGQVDGVRRPWTRRAAGAAVLALVLVACVVLGVRSCSHPSTSSTPSPTPSSPATTFTPEYTIHVATTGSATGDGSTSDPVTLDRAQQLVRQHRGHSVEVVVQAGRYQRTRPLALTSADSGTANAPVEWTVASGATATLVGGVDLTSSQLAAVTDSSILARIPSGVRSQVRVADLSSLSGLGTIPAPPSTGQSLPQRTPAPEVFFTSQPGVIARYPNSGWLTSDTAAQSGGRLTVSSASLKGHTWTSAEQPMVQGYWFENWADAAVPVVSASSSTGTLTARSVPYGAKAGQRFYLYNTLEELDTAGEYWIDRQHRKLYTIPPSGGGRVTVSVMTQPLLTLTDTSWVTIHGLGVTATRGDGVSVSGGSNVRLDAMSVTDVGGNGIVLDGTTSSTITHATVTQTGYDGIAVTAGNRTTLTAGGVNVLDCTISHTGRLERTYTPGISLAGVGNVASHNEIYDEPHAAIILFGNDHVVDHNDIHDAVQETDDAGAIYMGRDWTAGGNQVVDNLIADIGSSDFDAQVGVYLDDFSSGQRVADNVVAGADTGVLVGGGWYNSLTGNVFVATTTPLMADARGLSWAAKSCRSGSDLMKTLASVPVSSTEWAKSFPWLSSVASAPCSPRANTLQHNRWWGGTNDIASQFAATATISDEKVLSTSALPSAPLADNDAMWSAIASATSLSRGAVGPR